MPEPSRRIFGPALVLVPPMDGSTIDWGQIKRGLVVIHQRNPIDTVVMDISRAEGLREWMEETLGVRVLDRSQSNAAAVEDYSLFVEALANGWMLHQGDQALTQHVLNAVAKTLPFGDVRFDRPSSSRQGGNQSARVIDALTAASMVHTEAVREYQVEPEPESVYETDARRILI
jgi:phage terminase large subunit-like protein